MQDPAAAACTRISSLVLTLTEEPALRAMTLQALARIPGLELEERGGPWVAAVLDSSDPEAVIDGFGHLPGIRFVEVIFVEVAEPQLQETPTH
jgi:hypothetical protein